MNTNWKTYTCRYYHDGSWWGLDVVARDDDDAEARVRKLGNLQLLGEVKMTIPASTPSALVRSIVWIRNLLCGA
jgi:hypothetical protein